MARLSQPTKAAIGTSLAGGAISALSNAPLQFGHLFRGRFPTVAVTGMTGVGKTRLADRLARRASVEATLDDGSATMERRTRKTARGRGFRFRVVPGDNAATRLSALDEVFHDDPVDGVLHVVANGHATPRGSMPADATREALLAAELEDFAITSHRIASMAVRRDKPIWVVIVVAKADLFVDDVDAAVRYYSPGSGTPFGAKVDELRSLAGGARLSIDVMPMFTEAQASTGKEKKQADRGSAQLISRLESRMAQLSGHV
ncbi:GTPase domain-containing protein [Janibacter cremeus]|uniref:G domain-containing protein n=1 Tax=Janibacter cremeus TaxID=1285192 RepID=A0A852VSF8_9MICO|nr:GTPase domain-containing protein [Janibacter cremeus]NYF98370.1 hypothetical protein [Janibacter cremeus]